MPELPEVERVVRALSPKIEGATILEAVLSKTVVEGHKQGKQCIVKQMKPSDFEKKMCGMTIKKVSRRAKYILMDLEKQQESFLFVNHLGMTGAWFVVRKGMEMLEDKFRHHIHATFSLSSGDYLIFSDIRRFGEFRLLKSLEEYPPLLRLAPEPFDDAALSYFLEKCGLSKYQNKPIKEVIMDGQVVSGCGNIYATEALFQVGIHPARKAGRISEKRKIALFKAIQKVLMESIEMGGSTISDYRNINGEAGGKHRLKMYGKKFCPNCNTKTKSMTIGGRTSVYCPKCQH